MEATVCELPAYNYNLWAPRCVMYRDFYGDIIGCRNNTHLEQCEDFKCPPGFVKCPNSYCIPLHYINNQLDDCPLGQDEGAMFYNPNSNFVCNPFDLEALTFVHPDQVCDDIPQCPQGEDEWDCDVICEPNLICAGGAVAINPSWTVKTVKSFHFINRRTKYVDISGFTASDFFKATYDLEVQNILFLKLSNCDIESLYIRTHLDTSLDSPLQAEHEFRALLRLDLSHNNISYLGGKFGHFRRMPNLQSLNISYNKHLVVTGEDFKIIAEHLNILDLSYTAVNGLDKQMFADFVDLQNLYLVGCPLKSLRPIFPVSLRTLDLRLTNPRRLSADVFNKIDKLKSVYAPNYKVCCEQVRGSAIPSHACIAENDVLSSCTDLIEQPIQRVLLWIVGLFSLFGNVIVILYRLVWDRDVLLKSHGVFILNLSISDLMMGIYLIVIASADVKYSGSYVWHDQDWRLGNLCQLAGLMSTLSSESSAIFIFLITLDRFFVIKYPFGQVRFSRLGTVITCISAWLIGLAIAVLPLLPPFQHWEVYSTNGMCLGLPLNLDRPPGWQFSVAIFVGFNFLLFICIAAGQFSIYKAISGTKIPNGDANSRLSQRKRQQEFAVAKQLSLITITDFLCWFPIGALGLANLTGQEVGSDVYAWSAVLILPINSALNPVLYTVPALKKKWKKFKTGISSAMDTETSSVENTSISTSGMTDANALLKDVLAFKQMIREERLQDSTEISWVISNLLKECASMEASLVHSLPDDFSKLGDKDESMIVYY